MLDGGKERALRVWLRWYYRRQGESFKSVLDGIIGGKERALRVC